MRSRHLVSLFAAGAVAAALATSPRSSAAGYGRYTGANCAYVNGAGGRVMASSTGSIFACPISDDDRFPKSSATGLNVHVYDANTTASDVVAACVNYYGWEGRSCGPNAISGTDVVGNVMLTPSITAWTNPANSGHFPYIDVYLTANQDGRTSKLHGYYVH